MRNAAYKSLILTVLFFFSVPASGSDFSSSLRAAPAREIHWPSFRGPGGGGVVEGFSLPVTWNADDSDGKKQENIRWKTPVQGLGHSSPVIWGNRIFLTSSISGQEKPELKVGLYGDIAPVKDETEHQWLLYCLDKKTGKILWQRVVHKGVPRVQRHPKSTHANPSVATDGKHVVAFFGSEGLFCYDMNGRMLWKKDLGVLDSGFFMVPTAQWGFASSPVIFDNRVIVQCDVQKGSFLASFDVKTGIEIWRTARADVPTWGTPAVHRDGDRTQIIVNGYRHIGGYDFQTGKELWKLTGGGDIPVPTPVVSHGLIFITNSHGRMSPIYAIRVTASGDISLKEQETSNEHIAWFERRNGAYMPTPVVYGDYLYVLRDHGVLGCYEAKTGKLIYQERIGTGRTGFTASSVASDGKVFFTSEEGEIIVVKAGPRFEVLARNAMGEVCMATPAISEGTLFFRTQGHLVAVGEKR